MYNLNNSDKEKLIYDLKNSYKSYSLINYDFLESLTNSLQSRCFSFNNREYYFSEDNLSSIFNIKAKCNDIINFILCEIAKNDEEVLLQLMIDNVRIVSFVLRKLKLDEKNPIYDDYLKDCILTYDGTTSLSSWITSYFLKTTKKHYKPEIKTDKLDNKVTNQDQEKTPCDVGKNCQEAIILKVEDKDIKTKENISDTSVDEYINETEDNKKIETEPSQSNSVLEQDNLVEKKEDNHTNIYLICKEMCSKIKGVSSLDECYVYFRYFHIENYITTSNDEFLSYLFIRFGFVNDEFYSLEQISQMLNIPLVTIINYERYVVTCIKKVIEKNIDQYIELILQ